MGLDAGRLMAYGPEPGAKPDEDQATLQHWRKRLRLAPGSVSKYGLLSAQLPVSGKLPGRLTD
jgi:hypothetical protein